MGPTNIEWTNQNAAKILQIFGSIIEPVHVNLVNGSTTDLLTYYDVSGGSKDFIYQIGLRNSFSIQVYVSNLTGTLTGTLDIYGSNDNIHWAEIASTATSRLYLDTTPDTGGWTRDLANFDYIKVSLTVNGCTGGKLYLLMVLK